MSGPSASFYSSRPEGKALSVSLPSFSLPVVLHPRVSQGAVMALLLVLLGMGIVALMAGRALGTLGESFGAMDYSRGMLEWQVGMSGEHNIVVKAVEMELVVKAVEMEPVVKGWGEQDIPIRILHRVLLVLDLMIAEMVSVVLEV